MRNKKWRQELSFYRFTTQLATRHADMDMERHVNNVAVLGLHGEARCQFHLALFGAETWLAQTATVRLAGFENDFLRITHYPAPVICGVNLMDLSAREYTLAIALFQNESCVGLHECRMGAWHKGRRIALPAVVHDRLLESGIVREPS